MKIVIVDYGMGNIKSITGTLMYLGIKEVKVSSNYEDLKRADKLILPGVGSFGRAMKKISEKKLDIVLQKLVLKEKKPILGICLGMQLMGMSSTENGLNDGLKFIEGEVKIFDEENLKIPHVGFNQVKTNKNTRLYEGLSNDPDFYFTHSYKMESKYEIKQSFCNYGNDFIASFECENIAGVQFHPELSQNNGLKLINNFIEKF
jgi:glutamine amidotransferase